MIKICTKMGTKGTMLHDVIVLIGVIMLIALILFWAVRFGAAVVSDAMLQSPQVMQSNIASGLSMACGLSENLSMSWGVPQPYSMKIIYNNTHIRVKPDKSKYYYSEVERTGYVGFGLKPATAWINCGLDVGDRGPQFDGIKHRRVLLSRTADGITITAVR